MSDIHVTKNYSTQYKVIQRIHRYAIITLHAYYSALDLPNQVDEDESSYSHVSCINAHCILQLQNSPNGRIIFVIYFIKLSNNRYFDHEMSGNVYGIVIPCTANPFAGPLFIFHKML